MKNGLGFVIGLVVLLVLLVPVLFKVLWNWLMPEIFGLQTIGYWQAVGLMMLSSCLFYRGSSSSK